MDEEQDGSRKVPFNIWSGCFEEGSQIQSSSSTLQQESGASPEVTPPAENSLSELREAIVDVNMNVDVEAFSSRPIYTAVPYSTCHGFSWRSASVG